MHIKERTENFIIEKARIPMESCNYKRNNMQKWKIEKEEQNS